MIQFVVRPFFSPPCPAIVFGKRGLAQKRGMRHLGVDAARQDPCGICWRDEDVQDVFEMRTLGFQAVRRLVGHQPVMFDLGRKAAHTLCHAAQQVVLWLRRSGCEEDAKRGISKSFQNAHILSVSHVFLSRKHGSPACRLFPGVSQNCSRAAL